MGGIQWPVIGKSAVTPSVPLSVKPISRVVKAGETVELGSDDFELDLSNSAGQVTLRVVSGQFDTAGLTPGRYMLVARRGTQVTPAGRLIIS